MHNNQLNENLEGGDLKRLVHDELHIDEFKSKMGDDADVSELVHGGRLIAYAPRKVTFWGG